MDNSLILEKCGDICIGNQMTYVFHHSMLLQVVAHATTLNKPVFIGTAFSNG